MESFERVEQQAWLASLKGHMAGQRPRGRRRRGPERELVAAIILQALADALAGDWEAAGWMDYFAPDIAYVWLDIDPERIAAWRRVDPGRFSTSPAYSTALKNSAVFGSRPGRGGGC